MEGSGSLTASKVFQASGGGKDYANIQNTKILIHDQDVDLARQESEGTNNI